MGLLLVPRGAAAALMSARAAPHTAHRAQHTAPGGPGIGDAGIGDAGIGDAGAHRSCDVALGAVGTAGGLAVAGSRATDAEELR